MRARVLLALILAASALPAAAGPAIPAIDGPDLPALGTPTVVTVFDEAPFECTGSPQTALIQVPDGPHDRIVLELTVTPDGDPWDRLAAVAIGGAEVLRATTPRTEMTLRKDITTYSELLPPGGRAEVSLLLSTYVGALLGTVHLEFYADEPTAVAARAPAEVHPVALWGGLNGNGSTITTDVGLPEAVPAGAELELTITGHSGAEFWFTSGWQPRIFRVFADGVQIAEARSMHYTYAFVGFGAGDPYQTCAGPRTGATGDTLHPLMWWTAQRALDAAGVHLGVGEVPPYRAIVEPDLLPLLSGARTIEIAQVGASATWVTSVSLLLYR